MKIDLKKATSKLNRKKALIFLVRKKIFRPVFKGTIKSFTGYQTFALLKSTGYESFEINMQISKGEAALILVQKEKMTLLSKDSGLIHTKFEVEPGWVILRIIGKQTDCKFTLHRYSK